MVHTKLYSNNKTVALFDRENLRWSEIDQRGAIQRGPMALHTVIPTGLEVTGLSYGPTTTILSARRRNELGRVHLLQLIPNGAGLQCREMPLLKLPEGVEGARLSGYEGDRLILQTATGILKVTL